MTNGSKNMFMKGAAILIAGLFLFLGGFGLSFSAHTDMQGNMADCPFMGKGSKLCQMTLTQHLGTWQQVFTATSPSKLLIVVFMLIASAAFTVSIFAYSHFLGPPVPANYFEKIRHALSKLNAYLLEAFSQGILHPKIYS